jgi:hypothetical protein
MFDNGPKGISQSFVTLDHAISFISKRKLNSAQSCNYLNFLRFFIEDKVRIPIEPLKVKFKKFCEYHSKLKKKLFISKGKAVGCTFSCRDLNF